MKKILYLFGILIMTAAFSCKNEPKADDIVTIETPEDISDTDLNNVDFVSIETPKFSNAEVQSFAEEYAAFYTKIKEMIISGDSDLLIEMQNEATVWGRKAGELTQKMSESDKEIWQKWTQEIAEEIAEMQ